MENAKEEHLDFRQSERLQGFTYFLYPILSVNWPEMQKVHSLLWFTSIHPRKL